MRAKEQQKLRATHIQHPKHCELQYIEADRLVVWNDATDVAAKILIYTQTPKHSYGVRANTIDRSYVVLCSRFSHTCSCIHTHCIHSKLELLKTRYDRLLACLLAIHSGIVISSA